MRNSSVSYKPAGEHSRQNPGAKCNAWGFTLIELMVVLAIIAIIAAVAYPSYVNYIVKSKRSAAEACLSQHVNFMERYYTTNLSYYQDTSGNVIGGGAGGATLPPLGCDTENDMNKDYSFSFSVAPTAAAPTVYTVQAVPQGVQATRDKKCGTLKVDQKGTRTITGTGTVSDCW